MADEQSFITVNLDLAAPIELDDFVGFFGALSSQFDRYMKSEHPDVATDARIYVHEVRKGSIVADLFPGGVSDIIQLMDGVLIVTGFAGLVGGAIAKYAKGERDPDATKAQLNDFYNTVEGLAKDTDGRATVETATWENGLLKKKIAFTFTSEEARKAARTIEDQKLELDAREHADHSRVLMYFQRSDTGDAKVGRPSGERVIIEEIFDKPLALSYASTMAEERIKDVIRNAPANIYHIGFIVDVNVQRKGGKPVVYSITHIHQVLDLPKYD